VAQVWNTRLGMPGKVQPYPSIALGAFEATPLEMAAAYNVLATGGLKVEPITIVSVTDDGQSTLQQHYPAPPRVARPESTYLVVNMMRSVINNGTAAAVRSAGFTADAAGKTGTTNDLRDAWFAGFTADLLCVVWVGYDDNTPTGLSGSKAAVPIWVDFMKGAQAGSKGQKLATPAANIVFVKIDRGTGLLATPYCPVTIDESFIAGTEPQEMCSWHSGAAAEPWDSGYPAPSPSPWR
jgi:penicillin-binding protein 1B